MKAIQIHEHGGPEVLRYEELAERKPGAFEVLVGNRAIGVNFTDTYMRTGFIGASEIPVSHLTRADAAFGKTRGLRREQ